jgi:hypothetical protein
MGNGNNLKNKYLFLNKYLKRQFNQVPKYKNIYSCRCPFSIFLFIILFKTIESILLFSLYILIIFIYLQLTSSYLAFVFKKIGTFKKKKLLLFFFWMNF